MVVAKKTLTPEDIEGQTALELPDRHTLTCGGGFTVNVLSGNVLNTFSFNDIDQATNFCVFVINLNQGYQCTIFQEVPLITMP